LSLYLSAAFSYFRGSIINFSLSSTYYLVRASNSFPFQAFCLK
jgi:hypothetical protein